MTSLCCAICLTPPASIYCLCILSSCNEYLYFGKLECRKVGVCNCEVQHKENNSRELCCNCSTLSLSNPTYKVQEWIGDNLKIASMGFLCCLLYFLNGAVNLWVIQDPGGVCSYNCIFLFLFSHIYLVFGMLNLVIMRLQCLLVY